MYTQDIAFELQGTVLSLQLLETPTEPAAHIISNRDILRQVQRRFADVLDSWVDVDARGSRFSQAVAVAYRGDLLQWNGYPAVWWLAVLELVEAHTQVPLRTLTSVRGPRPLPRRMLRCLLRWRHSTRPSFGRETLLLGAGLSLGFFFGALEYGTAWIMHRRFGRKLACHGDCLVLLFAAENNTTKHVYRWLRGLPADRYTPYLLGSPLQARRQRPEWAAFSLPTPAEYFQGWRQGANALLSYLRTAGSSAPFVIHGGLTSWRRILLTGLRLFRYGIHSARLAHGQPLPPVAVFSLQLPEGILLDSHFPAWKTKSVHWLHGILAGRRNLDGVSSLAITKSSADASELKRSGHYQDARTGLRPTYPPPVFRETGRTAGGDLLVLSTIYHPTRVPPEELKLHELKEYLTVVGQVARALRCQVVWRPHPFEVQRNCVELMRPHLEPGLFVVDYQTPLKAQIESARQILTVASGAILDVIECGRVPAVYTGSFFESAGVPETLPDSVFFRDAHEAARVVALFEEAGKARPLFEDIQRRLSFDRDYLPATSDFSDLIR